ncbi:MAG: flagellar basal-body MS-ring/collar protein FliF [Peptococcaceae bacterium]|jgi:flagellar M-ring protein FliF|nr:flagellar M-ring protein FliF [Peptococcaceae bacterium]MDH7524032.1 flagellar basal-body MS-ring/collar protein FliF [Peptococcaceae bacterium]
MGFWLQFIEQAKKIWSNFTVWQKVTLAGIVLAAFTGVVALLFFSQPEMEPLYTNLDPRDASAITAKLKELKVDFQLADEGRTILVASKDKYQLRLDMAGQINLQGVVGFESFNETRFGETDTDKRVRFLVALQGELTRTIEELDEVEKAKVHIALPAPSLFVKDEKEPTASVLLRLKPYAQLKPEQIKSIMAFVSHSVEGLKAENVTIMDVNGNLLSEEIAESGTAKTPKISLDQLALKRQYEQELARSIQTMLERMQGAGKAVVRASVSMDFDQVETRSEKYSDPVLVSEQLKEETSKGTSGTGGENPADANMSGPSYGSAGSSGTTEHQLTERIRNYEVGKTVETKITAPGKVTRISVSVLIDGDITDQDQEKISEAVSSAAGLDKNRGDQVAIVAMPFNTAEADKLTAQMAAAEKDAKRWEYIKLALMALGGLLLLGLAVYAIRGFGTLVKQTGLSASTQAAATVPAAPSVDLSMPLTGEAAEKKNLRKQVEQIVQSNPEDVAKVVKTWLAEE